MLKSEELKNPESCLNKARSYEMIFVLLGRDVATPAAIRAWTNKRIEMGKNTWGDAQIIEAEQCATFIEQSLGVSARPAAAPSGEVCHAEHYEDFIFCELPKGHSGPHSWESAPASAS
jgi:hypothetical protein